MAFVVDGGDQLSSHNQPASYFFSSHLKITIDSCLPLRIMMDMNELKNKAAQELGSLGGKARAAKLTQAERVEIASKAAKARWAKSKAVKP